MVWSAYYV